MMLTFLEICNNPKFIIFAKTTVCFYCCNKDGFRIKYENCPSFLLSRLLYITEGKYWNQLKEFRKFRVVLSSGSHETGRKAEKVTVCV